MSDTWSNHSKRCHRVLLTQPRCDTINHLDNTIIEVHCHGRSPVVHLRSVRVDRFPRITHMVERRRCVQILKYEPNSFYEKDKDTHIPEVLGNVTHALTTVCINAVKENRDCLPLHTENCCVVV